MRCLNGCRKSFEKNPRVRNKGNGIGVPDSTLSHFSGALIHSPEFSHHVCPNEGTAVGVVTGIYLATGAPACVYMQNSGLGNSMNPVTSLLNRKIYDIPMLFVVGWRGEPTTKDEPQHRFMGKITRVTLDLLEIEHAVISKETNQGELDMIFRKASASLRSNKQYAIVVKRGALAAEEVANYANSHGLIREKAITMILGTVEPTEIVVSTTGKISREVYEYNVLSRGLNGQAFLTVGGMGHASAIALGIANNIADRKVYCLDGDGAILMHMGSLAQIAKQQPGNFIHICLNNEAHESVGGMPTCAVGVDFAGIASACGYPYVFTVKSETELNEALMEVRKLNKLCFIEILVALSSRPDLGRPKESAVENRVNFMKYHGVIK